MTLLGQAKAAVRMAATRLAGGTLIDCARLSGKWTAQCRRYLTLSDPEKAMHLVRPAVDANVLPGTIKPITRGRMPRKFLTELPDDFAQLRKDLEKLVTDGDDITWSEAWTNIVVNEGLDELLDVTLSNGTQVTAWYIGLLGSTPSPLATWTAGDLAAVDFVAYSEANLQTWQDDGVSGQSVTNSTTSDFSVTADTSTIGGGFLISSNTKATPAGTLYAAGAFSGGDKAADSGDTLQVTATFGSADDGV